MDDASDDARESGTDYMAGQLDAFGVISELENLHADMNMSGAFVTLMRILKFAFMKFYIVSQFEDQQPIPACFYLKEFAHGVQQLFLGKAMTDKTILGTHRPRIEALFVEFRRLYPDLTIARPLGNLEHVAKF
ncbi:hypothetical protein BC940DRAFT_337282 [Gongronella butleri]|nr:hypothetical protein BC940DRAFT_337282 [Gongronella butleri]